MSAKKKTFTITMGRHKGETGALVGRKGTPENYVIVKTDKGEITVHQSLIK